MTAAAGAHPRGGGKRAIRPVDSFKTLIYSKRPQDDEDDDDDGAQGVGRWKYAAAGTVNTFAFDFVGLSPT